MTSLVSVCRGFDLWRPSALILVLIGCLLFGGTEARAATVATPVLPCDIYASAGTPCVAAHSTVRAIFGTYSGPLYRVTRASDSDFLDIGLLAPGGYADAAAQDDFCAATSCIIKILYDQSPKKNHLIVEGPGSAGKTADKGAPADALPITAGGRHVYGISFSGQMGYRNDATSGVAVNGQPEGMYMVTSGTHVNKNCCFDYGNAETDNTDPPDGNGRMDAVYFGLRCRFGCYGNGPWVHADLENGLFSSSTGASTDTSYTGDLAPYVTVLLKNNGQNYFAIKSGNAQNGKLILHYGGKLPTAPGYAPMRQEGAIVLGTGGDNSNGSIGSFFEGVMTAGLPTDDADDEVQANILTVHYGAPTGSAGSLVPGSEIALEMGAPTSLSYLLANPVPAAATVAVVTSSSPVTTQSAATWIVRRGFSNNSCLSFETKNYPGNFLRHSFGTLYAQSYDASTQFQHDATFCPYGGLSGQGTSFEAVNFPGRYITFYDGNGVIAAASSTRPQDDQPDFKQNASWFVLKLLVP